LGIEKNTDSHGRTYYFNVQTRQTGWTIDEVKAASSKPSQTPQAPPQTAQSNDLIRKIPTTSSRFVKETKDPQSGKTYYYNIATGATGWTLESVQNVVAEAVSVPQERIGFIIGKQGETIKSIQQRHGVVLEIIPTADPLTSEAKITGKPAAVRAAVEEVCALIGILLEDEGSAAAGAAAAVPAAAAATAARETRRLRVPASKIGLIIGKKGETIKRIQSESGANVRVVREDDAGDPDFGCVELSGSSGEVDIAEEGVRKVVDGQKQVLYCTHCTLYCTHSTLSCTRYTQH
jgi:rRNA processing protein Krr1/Pno1